MTTVQKLRKYIRDEMAAGRLKPGDSLPGLRRVCNDLGCFYTTAQRAVKELGREGVLRIEHGRGAFLTGDKALESEVAWEFDVIDRKVLYEMMMRQVNRRRLNLKLNLIPVTAPVQEKNAIHPRISVDAKEIGSELNHLPGYREWKKMLPGATLLRLPFTYAPHAVGVNLDLMKQIGFSGKQMTPGFGWFREYAEKANRAGFHPMSREFRKIPSLNWAQGILMELAEGNAEKLTGPEAFFTTEAGHCFLEIARNTAFYNAGNPTPAKESFYRGGAGLAPLVGSWITAQNQSSFRPDMRVPHLGFRNYLLPDGRRLLPVNRQPISIRIPEDFDDARLARLAGLVDILLSREFQIEYCRLTGMLSERSDIDFSEYFPMDDESRKLLPGPDSVSFSFNVLYSYPVMTMLQAMLESALDFPEHAESILEKMDFRRYTIQRQSN